MMKMTTREREARQKEMIAQAKESEYNMYAELLELREENKRLKRIKFPSNYTPPKKKRKKRRSR